MFALGITEQIIGQQFQAELKLKGFSGWIASLLFNFILKGLKFMFLDDIAAELLNRPGNKITSSDIESVVRRVGVDALISPVMDQFLLINFINLTLMALTLGCPFLLFWLL